MTLLIAALLTLTTSYAPCAEKAAEPDLYVGIQGGVGIAAGGASASFGADLGYRFSSLWRTGLSVSYQSLPTSAADSSLLLVGDELHYSPPQLAGGYAGLKLGIAATSSAATATSISNLNAAATPEGTINSFAFAAGMTAGYEHKVYADIYAGAETSLLYITRTGTSIALQACAAVKYCFY